MAIDRRGLLIWASAVGGGLAIGALGSRRGWWEAEILAGGTDPNAAIRRLARAREASLVRAYDAALLLDATANEQLSSYRGHHLDHLLSLGGSADEVEAAQPLPVPTDTAALAGFFGAQEQTWSVDAQTGVRISPDRELARLFALIAASEATHVWGWTHGG